MKSTSLCNHCKKTLYERTETSLKSDLRIILCIDLNAMGPHGALLRTVFCYEDSQPPFTVFGFCAQLFPALSAFLLWDVLGQPNTNCNLIPDVHHLDRFIQKSHDGCKDRG